MMGTGLTSDAGGTDRIVRAANTTNIVFEQQSKLISFFGRLNYNINDRYIFAASLRHDGSSRFGAANDYGNFPSVSAAWRLSEESFLRGMKGLSDLKLRASWAKTGNQSFGNYLAYSSYQLGDNQTQYEFGDTVFTTSRPSAVDPDIKWEQTRAVNLGLDFGFANQRITGAIDYYDKLTDDLLFTVPVAGFSNLSNFVTTNIGSMRNYGIELSLGARILDGGGPRPELAGGLHRRPQQEQPQNHHPVRRVRARHSGRRSVRWRGHQDSGPDPGPPGELVLRLRAHPREREADLPRRERRRDGINDQDLYVDQNGDGIINQGDLRPFHDPAPKWILGHSSYFAWGKFDFGFTLRSYLGNYVYNNVASANGDYRELTAGSSPLQPAQLRARDPVRDPAAPVGLLRAGRVLPADGQHDARLHVQSARPVGAGLRDDPELLHHHRLRRRGSELEHHGDPADVLGERHRQQHLSRGPARSAVA